MNEADPSPINLDELRLVPDWLREDAPVPSQQYATHNYPLGDSSGRRGSRPGGFGGRPERGEGRPSGGGPSERRREGGRPSGGPRRGDDRGPRSDSRPPQEAPRPEPAQPAPIRVEFLPDDRCLASINKQIRSTHLAYPLFGLARMFLQEPERHFVQFSVAPDAPAGTQLFQLGEDGPVTLDRATIEKMAFDAAREQFYVEETVQKDPLKGNFTNVARERLSGTLLGPTNYHAYQPALRSLYESRYSRRMSFEDFRRNVEVSTDPALIERWKEEARTTTTTSTRVAEGETPVVLNSQADVRTHFRQHHLDQLIQSGTRLKVHGSVARKLPEPGVMQAIRFEHDQEMRYPAQFVQLLRQGLQNAGLHIFKHRKRVVYVSLARPTPFVAHGTVSPNVSAILETIARSPLCTRKILAEQVLSRGLGEAAISAPRSASAVSDALSAEAATAMPAVAPEGLDSTDVAATPPPAGGDDESSKSTVGESEQAVPTILAVTQTGVAVEPAGVFTSTPQASTGDDLSVRAKAALAADLRFLVQSGHIIEFHNGTFDLPLPPKAKEEGVQNQPPVRKNPPAHRSTPQRETDESHFPGAVDQPQAAVEFTPEKTFVAVGVGVEEAISSSVDALVEQSPSMDETIEPAPTAASLVEELTAAEMPSGSGEAAPVHPEVSANNLPVGLVPDKVDGDGMISGPAAAPMDLPIPGDSEDPLTPRP